VTLVLGGARSGKSRFAEALVSAAGAATYIATAEPRDVEMKSRIAAHRDRRGSSWQTLEAPLDLAAALSEADTSGRPVLLDCLTLWLSNVMEDGRDIGGETDRLVSSLAYLTCPVVMVSNEVGQGIVPANALARRFRDQAGALNQTMAAFADRVFFVTAGIPAQLK
jgi:adenosylcobinamide kinase/adenosylcobinamide-phosphate guanylyltransferase